MIVLLITFALLATSTVSGPSPRSSTQLAVQSADHADRIDVAVADSGPNAFGRALVDIEPDDWQLMRAGKAVFSRRWMPVGSGSAGLGDAEGLGPLFNANSCTGCHFKDGRGALVPRGQKAPAPAVHRLAPDRINDPHIAAWGRQIQDRSTARRLAELGGKEVTMGGLGEARPIVVWDEFEGRYPDGSSYRLRRPQVHLEGIETPPPMSRRVPPTLVGMGYLEAIAEATILALADPDDLDGDGISGRARPIGDRVKNPSGSRLGRFGWKADQPTLREQVLGALAEDMGISSAEFPFAGCPPTDKACRADANSLDGSPEPEMSTEDLDLLVRYLHLLAPPAARFEDPADKVAGAELFRRVGCDACHRPTLATGTVDDFEGPAALANRQIEPYTDLLLHDLGPGLADGGIDEPEVSRREWRTAPLWGLGLLDVVNGSVELLHDGRARTFEEAILWHGGEAEPSRRRFEHLSAADRAMLLEFLAAL